MEADDLSLVESAKAGDTGAFTALVVRYQRKVYAVALGIVKDPDSAWDVAQEAFVRVHKHLPEFKGDSAFATWLFRIATHLAIDSVRKERKSQKDDIDDLREVDLEGAGDGILSTSLGQDPRENALRRELAKLQPDPRQALTQWLTPEPGQQLEDHLYLVDPMGEWMMRFPVEFDPAKVKRDIDRLLRAASSWDRAGR